jgi:hypothetical protein
MRLLPASESSIQVAIVGIKLECSNGLIHNSLNRTYHLNILLVINWFDNNKLGTQIVAQPNISGGV